MPQQYSQITAMLAVMKASLKATFRSPQSIFFSLFFPIVLIWIFGSLGGSGVPSAKVAFEKGIDSTTELYQTLKNHPYLKFVSDKNKDIEDELRKGRIAAIINIERNTDPGVHSPYIIQSRTSQASQREYQQFLSILNGTLSEMNEKRFPELFFAPLPSEAGTRRLHRHRALSLPRRR